MPWSIPYLGGEVTVEDALGVQVAEATGDVEGQLDTRGPGEGHRAVQQLLQVPAVDVLMGRAGPSHHCTPPPSHNAGWPSLIPMHPPATPRHSCPGDLALHMCHGPRKCPRSHLCPLPRPAGTPRLTAAARLSPPSARAAVPGARTPP